MKYILLAEDDPFLIDIYVTKLEQEGFEVKIATNGLEVLTKLKEKIPNVLVLDIGLPQIDGWEILKRVKEDSKLKKLKIIILSNFGQKEDIEKGLGLGATKYLIKACFTPGEVVEEIKNL